MQQAIGILETKGLIALVTGTDAMLKAADVRIAGPMTSVGNAMVSVTVFGNVAAVKAAIDAGADAARTVGEVLSAHVIARPVNEVSAVSEKSAPSKKSGASK